MLGQEGIEPHYFHDPRQFYKSFHPVNVYSILFFTDADHYIHAILG